MLQWFKEAARSTVGYLHNAVQHRQGQARGDHDSPGQGRSPGNVHMREQDQFDVVHQKAVGVIKDWGPLCQLRSVLTQCSNVPELMSRRDRESYTLLQHAIMANRPNVVQFLVGLGAEVNAPICGRPLHLSAKLGLIEIVKILLDSNADPAVMSCVCYPSEHQSAKHMYNPDTERWTLVCSGDIYSVKNAQKVRFDYPLYFAVQSDSVECVKLFLDRGVAWVNRCRSLLHLACAAGAFKCVQYIIEQNAAGLNGRDHNKMTPIQYAVNWGKSMVEYLVLKGASVSVKTENNETLFHLVYNSSRFPDGLAATTSYLLNCGLGLNINAVDSAGNSALSRLLVLAHYTQKDGPRDQSHGLDLEGKLSVHDEILACVKMLLDAGANPNVCDKQGNTALHFLVTLDRDLLDVGQVSNRQQMPKLNFQLTYKILELLAQYKAKFSLVNNADETVLGAFFRSAIKSLFEPPPGGYFQLPLKSVIDSFIECLHLLHKNGCSFNKPKCLVHQMLTQLDRLDAVPGQHMLDMPSQEDTVCRVATEYVQSAMSIIKVLLQCGCSPNTCKNIQCDLHTMYYKLMGRSHIVPSYVIKDFVLLFLRHGTDPNIGGKHIPMSVFRYRSSQAYWPVYPLLHIANLIGSRESWYAEEDLLELFEILYSAMDDGNARQCIQHYLDHDRFRGRAVPHNHEFDKYLCELVRNARDLKQICRLAIYKALGRNLDRLDELPLPTALKQSVYNLQS